MATCTQPSTKHDLNRIYQKSSELLRSYIRCFFEMRNSIPNITEEEVIIAFIRGLHHRALCSKFNRKAPTGIGEMITTTNQYADTEEAKVRFNEDAGTHRPTHHSDDHPDDQTTVTATMMTAAIIGTVAVIGQKDPSLVNIATADQTISSPLSTNLGPSATMMSSTRRSSRACALSTKTQIIR